MSRNLSSKLTWGVGRDSRQGTTFAKVVKEYGWCWKASVRLGAWDSATGERWVEKHRVGFISHARKILLHLIDSRKPKVFCLVGDIILLSFKKNNSAGNIEDTLESEGLN